VLPSAPIVANRDADRADHAELRLKISLTGLSADVVVIDCPNRQGGPLTLSALNAAYTVVYAATATSDGIDGVGGARRTVALFRRHRQQLGAPDTLTDAGIVVGGVKETIMSRAAVASLEELRDHRVVPGAVDPGAGHRPRGADSGGVVRPIPQGLPGAGGLHRDREEGAAMTDRPERPASLQRRRLRLASDEHIDPVDYTPLRLTSSQPATPVVSSPPVQAAPAAAPRRGRGRLSRGWRVRNPAHRCWWAGFLILWTGGGMGWVVLWAVGRRGCPRTFRKEPGRILSEGSCRAPKGRPALSRLDAGRPRGTVAGNGASARHRLLIERARLCPTTPKRLWLR
jgi:hypothetical protein